MDITDRIVGKILMADPKIKMVVTAVASACLQISVVLETKF